MVWGSFGVVHITSLILAAAAILGGYFLMRKLPARVRHAMMIVLSVPGLYAIVYNLTKWGTPLEYLPLHMCSITAILIPIAILTRNNKIGNVLLLWGLGALAALVINQVAAEYVVGSPAFLVFYIPHVCEVAAVIYLFAFRYVKIRPRYIPSTLVITVGIYTVVHFCNVVINRFCLQNNLINPSGELIQVNYMYSITPEIPFLQMIWDLIPYRYWYMYGMIGIVALYLLLLFVPLWIRELVKRNKMKK